MFELDTAKSWVDATPEEVVYLSNSINRSSVAPPDRAPEPAQAFISAILRDGSYHVYIYLHLTTSNVGLLYRWDEGGVSKDMVPALQRTAMDFTGSMGFMMDDTNFRKLTPERKQSLFNETPVFHQDLSSFATAAPEPAAANELLIEPVEGETVEELTIDSIEGVSAEVVAESEDAEDEPSIFAEEPTIEEVTLGGDEEPMIEEEVNADEEDILLDALEVKEEPHAEAEPEAVATANEITPITPTAAVQEGPQVAEIQMLEPEAEAEAIIESEPVAEMIPEEPVVEAQPDPVQEAPVIQAEPAPARTKKPKSVPKVAATDQAAGVESASSPIPDADLSDEDFQLLVRFLAMM